MEVRGVGTMLRPKAITKVSMGDSWWEGRFLIALFLKLVWSSWSIQRWFFPRFLVWHISRKSFLNEGLEYGSVCCVVMQIAHGAREAFCVLL